MSTKADNILNPSSCWNRASNDEPIFVLRATDPSAPDFVTLWANRYVLAKGGFMRMTPEQQAKYYEALRVANEMREWFEEDDIPF